MPAKYWWSAGRVVSLIGHWGNLRKCTKSPIPVIISFTQHLAILRKIPFEYYLLNSSEFSVIGHNLPNICSHFHCMLLTLLLISFFFSQEWKMFNKLRRVGLLNDSVIYSHNSSTTNTTMCLPGMQQQKLYSLHSENIDKINFSWKFADTSFKV